MNFNSTRVVVTKNFNKMKYTTFICVQSFIEKVPLCWCWYAFESVLNIKTETIISTRKWYRK